MLQTLLFGLSQEAAPLRSVMCVVCVCVCVCAFLIKNHLDVHSRHRKHVAGLDVHSRYRKHSTKPIVWLESRKGKIASHMCCEQICVM